MMKINLYRLIVVVGMTLALVAPVMPAWASPAGQDVIYFDKAYNPAESAAANTAVFTGIVDGDVVGNLKSTRLDYRTVDDGTIVLVTFKWEIRDTDLGDGDQSFTAVASGTLNNANGKVVMNGEVVDGYLLGAKFIEQGQLVDAATLRFRGSMKLVKNSG
jgi:hypothetical protein